MDDSSDLTNQPQSVRTRSFHARVVPTISSTPARDPDPPSSDDSSSVGDSVDSSDGSNDDIGSVTNASESEEDQNDAGGFRSRNERGYNSFRLNSFVSPAETQRQGNTAVHVTPNQFSTFRLRPTQPEEDEEEDEPFTFLPPDQEVKIPEKTLPRAKKAIEQVAALASKIPATPEPEEEGEKKESCCERLFARCRKKKEHVKEEAGVIEPSTEITPEMQRASSQGASMVKTIMFPAVPSLLQDLWVYLELGISIAAFVLGIIDFAGDDPSASATLFTVLSVISMVLALIDSYFYFVQSGSIAKGVKACIKKLKKGRKMHGMLEEELGEDDGEGSEKKCCKFSESFDTWFELVRTVLSELLLYPLIITDMYGLVAEATYDVIEEPDNHTDFSLFVVSQFYLILGVYIMRIFVIAGSMIALMNMPKNKAALGDESDDKPLLIKFCAHILGQIAVHFLIIVVVGAKMNNEQSALEALKELNLTDPDLNLPEGSSPFLITAILLGWVVPIFGILTFFVVNYYWMKEFSIGFWLNMISLLQGESFAETVFGGDSMSVTKDKALDFVEKTQYKKVKKQLKRFKAPSYWTKFFFPLRVPLTALCGLLYDIALLSLIACLMLTYIPDEGVVKIVIFADDDIMTSIFMISVTAIIGANIHVLFLLNVVLLSLVVVFAIGAALAVTISPFILLIYFPTLALVGYSMLCIDTSNIANTSHRPKFEELGGELGEVIRNPATGTFEVNEFIDLNGTHSRSKQ